MNPYTHTAAIPSHMPTRDIVRSLSEDPAFARFAPLTPQTIARMAHQPMMGNQPKTIPIMTSPFSHGTIKAFVGPSPYRGVYDFGGSQAVSG